MKINKLFMALVIGVSCNYALTAMEHQNTDESENKTLSSYEAISVGDIHTCIFKDLDVKSVVQLRGVSTTMLDHVTQSFVSLNRHQLVVSEITDNMLPHLNVFANLTELNLGQLELCLNLTDKGLRTLQLTNLKQLDLGGSYQVTPAGLTHINLSNLNQLNISNCGGLMNGTLDYGNLTNLTSLNMFGLERNTDAELIKLTVCTNLTSLDLRRWNQITNPGLLTSLTNLKQLSLEGCFEITDEKIEELKDKNPNLEIIK